MYAVIEQGGKQHKVAEGDKLNIELTDVSPEAKTLELTKVLFVSDGQKTQIGTPYIEGATVLAEFSTTAQEAMVKGPKLLAAHSRRTDNSRKRIGHRQKYLAVTVRQIKA